ncbi:Zinc finger MYND-type [Pyrenophora seminiperda CCB06]|uniref:Zinc finger MYND-type n=1 Tax=Pyrenophora seminiperda CCB06 TaxID=1302712 RepID=A0A3M7LY62_9PLEO|nr:Zinc finger MYND-type [Pyrenophora seminiperda CCB06]
MRKCGDCKTENKSLHYCGAICQRKDWPMHKKDCRKAQDARLEKILARVAVIVQQGYYEFRENTWDTPIISIEDRDNELVIRDGDMLAKTKYFIKFPQHMVSSERTKTAMLSGWVCNETLAFMHDVIVDLLKGLDVDIKEVRINHGRVPRRITYNNPYGGHDANWPNYSHEILRITSPKSKTQWVIDISGAQYGITKAFWTWAAYANEYMVDVKAASNFGYNKNMFKKLKGIPGNPSMAYGVVGIVAEHMNQAYKKWATDRNMSLSDIPAMDEDDFLQAKKEVLRTVNDAVRAFLAKNSFEKEFTAAQAYERKFPGNSTMQYKLATSVR